MLSSEDEDTSSKTESKCGPKWDPQARCSGAAGVQGPLHTRRPRPVRQKQAAQSVRLRELRAGKADLPTRERPVMGTREQPKQRFDRETQDRLVKKPPTMWGPGFNPRAGKASWRRERLPTHSSVLAWRIL